MPHISHAEVTAEFTYEHATQFHCAAKASNACLAASPAAPSAWAVNVFASSPWSVAIPSQAATECAVGAKEGGEEQAVAVAEEVEAEEKFTAAAASAGVGATLVIHSCTASCTARLKYSPLWCTSPTRMYVATAL